MDFLLKMSGISRGAGFLLCGGVVLDTVINLLPLSIAEKQPLVLMFCSIVDNTCVLLCCLNDAGGLHPTIM